MSGMHSFRYVTHEDTVEAFVMGQVASWRESRPGKGDPRWVKVVLVNGETHILKGNQAIAFLQAWSIKFSHSMASHQ